MTGLSRLKGQERKKSFLAFFNPVTKLNTLSWPVSKLSVVIRQIYFRNMEEQIKTENALNMTGNQDKNWNDIVL